MTGDYNGYKKTLGYSFPSIAGSFFREFFSVLILLFLQQRVESYDLFNGGFVLLLVLLTFRAPFINSYSFFFELKAFKEWNVIHHVGSQRLLDPLQQLMYFIAVLGAHILASLAAAAATVYCNVMFGVEESSLRAMDYSLSVDIDGLRKIDNFWGSDRRISRLEERGMFNGSRSESMPLKSVEYLGLDSMAPVAWYFLEDLAYVLLLCMCLIHIWLATGVADDGAKSVKSPFKQEYWNRLFRTSFMLVLVYMALSRAFPTAHGSLHVTVFKYYYQQWNPSVYVIDLDNKEGFIRIFGALVGLALSYLYNSMLVSTGRPDSEDYYYRFIWGTDRPTATKGGDVQDRSVDDWDPGDGVVCVTHCTTHGDRSMCNSSCNRAPVRRELSVRGLLPGGSKH